jgi:hypothetical protein
MMRVPDDAPNRCPVCDDAYDSVSAHDAGLMVNLIENDRYQRVCFDPVESDSGDALVYFYHHTHHETETNAHTGAVDTECN